MTFACLIATNIRLNATIINGKHRVIGSNTIAPTFTRRKPEILLNNRHSHASFSYLQMKIVIE